MVAIYEQRAERGNGLHFNEFKRRFRAICEDFMRNGFKLIVMVFYDFRNENDPLRSVLRRDGGSGFSQLATLTGEDIVIFYFHTSTNQATGMEESFNHEFLRRLDIRNTEFPLVVLFTPNQDDQRFQTMYYSLANLEVEVVFHELYELIRNAKAEFNKPQRNDFISRLRVAFRPGIGEAKSFFWQKIYDKGLNSIQDLFY